MISALVTFAFAVAVSAPGDEAPALVCVTLDEPFVPGVTTNAMVKAVRERLATQNIDVLPCASAGDAVNARIVMRRVSTSHIEVTATGEGVGHTQQLDIDPRDVADVVRQASLIASELVDTSLIAWRDERDSAFYTEPEKTVPVAPPAEPREPSVGEPTPLRLALGGAAGVKLSADALAYRLELATQLRLRKWRGELDVGADRSGTSTAMQVDTTLTNLTLGVTVGRELWTRLIVGIGAQGQRTFASVSSSTRPVRSVAAWDYGARVVAKVALWRSEGLEVGVGGRFSWWQSPIRLTIEGAELRRGPRVDTTLFAFATVVMGP